MNITVEVELSVNDETEAKKAVGEVRYQLEKNQNLKVLKVRRSQSEVRLQEIEAAREAAHEREKGIRLYILDEGNPETLIPVVTDDPHSIRSDVGNEDHGGMPWEDFARVCDTAEIKQIKNRAELPPDLLNCYPYIGGTVESFEMTCEALIELMDDDGIIHDEN